MIHCTSQRSIPLEQPGDSEGSFNAVYEMSFFAGRDLAYFLLFQLQGDSRCDKLISAELKKNENH